MVEPIILPFVFAIIMFIFIAAMISRFKRCPPNKVMVIYGKTRERTATFIRSGGAFIIPIIQDYTYLDLTPISINAKLSNALSKDDRTISLICKCIIAIDTANDYNLKNAVERLLGLSSLQIQSLSEDVLLGQLRLTIATMAFDEIDCRGSRLDEMAITSANRHLQLLGLKTIDLQTNIIRQ